MSFVTCHLSLVTCPLVRLSLVRLSLVTFPKAACPLLPKDKGLLTNDKGQRTKDKGLMTIKVRLKSPILYLAALMSI